MTAPSARQGPASGGGIDDRSARRLEPVIVSPSRRAGWHRSAAVQREANSRECCGLLIGLAGRGPATSGPPANVSREIGPFPGPQPGLTTRLAANWPAILAVKLGPAVHEHRTRRSWRNEWTPTGLRRGKFIGSSRLCPAASWVHGWRFGRPLRGRPVGPEATGTSRDPSSTIRGKRSAAVLLGADPVANQVPALARGSLTPAATTHIDARATGSGRVTDLPSPAGLRPHEPTRFFFR